MRKTIKKIIHPGFYSDNINVVLLILRVVIGIFMLTHGVGKFQKLFGSDPIQFGDPLGVGITTSLILAVFAEVFCSILIIIGLGTRFAAIPLFVTMIVASFIVHINDDFSKQEFALLYALIFMTIATIGSGKFSLDYLISQNRKSEFKNKN
ncbi:MAG TPA: DoxX family protein [Edaphocola sp.]|nr:DoxX family protein [Edaphocola sp.]